MYFKDSLRVTADFTNINYWRPTSKVSLWPPPPSTHIEPFSSCRSRTCHSMASLLRRSAPRLIGSICPSRPQGPPRRFSSTCSATKPTSVPGLWVSFGLLGAVGALGLGFGASAGAKQAERQRAVPAPDISPPEVDSSTSPQQSAFSK